MAYLAEVEVLEPSEGGKLGGQLSGEKVDIEAEAGDARLAEGAELGGQVAA